MVSWLPHAVIPGLTALAFFRGVPRKTILLTLPLVWVIDADYIIQSQHRAISHSVLAPLAILAAVVALWRRRDPTARFWEYATRPGTPVVLSLLAYYWASHIVLDLFQGGVVMFWPFLQTNYFLDFQILLNTRENTFESTGSTGTSQGAPELSPTYPWLSYEHTAIAAFLAACAAVALGTAAWRRWRGRTVPRPAVVERVATLAGPIQKP